MTLNRDTIKNLGIIITLLLITKICLSQEIKYDDLIVEADKLSAKQRYSRFFEYQKQDPHFANTYIQLGDACEKIFLELDPLRNLQLINYWTNNAVLYYGLFPVYLKSNEVRRNREYYANFPIITDGRKLENEDVLLYVESRINHCRNFKDSLALIFNALENSKEHYNSCVKIFKDLNDKYDNLNQALLLTDNDFLSLLDSLDNKYQSAVREFVNYQKMIKEFHIGEYRQEFVTIPIQTFRLDGLTNSDFLKNSFTIWDYGKWVADYRKLFNTEIASLRNEIESINKTFNDNKRRLMIVESVDEEFKLNSYDDLFMFRLGKYDNNSLVRDLFRYLNIRQDFLINVKSPLNLATDSSSMLMNRKFRFYHGLAIHKMQTQQMLNQLNSSITPEKVMLFSDFFKQSYQGAEGLKNFSNQEGLFLGQTLEQSFENLKRYLSNISYNQYTKRTSSGAKGISVPLYPILPSDPDFKKYTHLTQNIFPTLGSPKYAYGYINRLGRKPLAFVAKVSDDMKIEWIREIGAKGKAILPNGDNTSILYGYDNGSVSIVSGELDTITHNTFVRLDNNGNELINKKLEINQKPTFIKFDDINQLTIMAFGQPEADSTDYMSSITICQADSIGELTWEAPLEVKGKLVDIIKTGDRYLAFINCISYNWNSMQNESNFWGAIALTLNEDGEILKLTPFTSTGNYHIDKVFAISNDEISLIGYASEPGNTEGKLTYLLINPNSEVKFKNF